MRKYIEEYKSQADWRVKENSNTVYSYSGLKNQLAETVLAKDALAQVPEELSFMHKEHFCHYHDLSGFESPYCAGWSTKDILLNGINVDMRFPTSAPAKHLGVALEHILNLTFILSGEFAGAQAFSSLDVYMAPFIKEDNLGYVEVKQLIQRLIFSLSQKYRSGLQSPFSNFTMDLAPLGEMKEEYAIVGGKEMSYTYGDCQKEIDLFNKAFFEVMSNGDSLGKPFSFPIPTYSITKDFDWESETADQLFDMAVKSGIPYFSNFVNSDLDPNDVRSMCCRLRLDKTELVNNGGGLFGSGEKTGSIGVATLNMGRLSFIAQEYLDNPQASQLLSKLPKSFQDILFKDSTVKERFEHLIGYTMDRAAEFLVIKRDVNEANLKAGLFPYTSVLLEDYSNHFNTIGLIGMHEALLNMHFEEGIVSDEGRIYAEHILDVMLSRLKDYQVKWGDYYTESYGYSKGLLFNLEASPGEGAGTKLAKYDRELFGDKINLANGRLDLAPYYTNSTQVPQDHEINASLFDVLDNQDKLQSKYTSGTVFHIYTEGKLTKEKGKALIKKACENYTMPYLSLSPTITICPIHGRLDKEYEFCPFDHTEEELDYIEKMGGIYITTPSENKE